MKKWKRWVKHCGGLPLAIKVLGGLLAAQHTLSEWNRVHENIRSHIVGGTTFNDRIISSVDHILYLSFEELPVYLKQCFLYFAHFPEDHPLRVRDLSYYWAAEGIPRPRYYDGATIEEVGNGCIEELVKRNMVISERDVRTTRFETYRLHDMMKEVCLLKAKEENFVHIVDIANSQSPCTSRRIAVHQLDETYHSMWELDETYHPKWELDETYHPKWEIKNPKLRSLLIIKEQSSAKNWMASGLCFTKLQLMRVLDLSYAKFEGGKLPSDIGKLIHLRYLSLYQAHVNHLPSSMRNLKLLLYLNLTIVGSTYIPNFLKDMRSLAYLSLPLIMHIKTKLELGNLVNLETLLHFSTKNSSVSDLHRMTKLKNLSIHFRGEGCATKTVSSSLSELRRLGNLTISLEDCRLVEDPMPFLEKLIQLKELYLGYKSFSGKRMVCSNGGFPQLQKLSIQELKKWEEWIVEEGSMPLLHTLNIWNCPKLKELPDGLKFISSKNLILDGIWKERLSEGGEDYYKRCSIGMAFLVVINLLLEIVSAVSDQLSSIRKPYFATISLLMSISSVVLSILDLTNKIQAHKARFRCKWPIPWFYHPEDGYIKIFGNFTNTVLLFCVVGGLIVSTVNYSYIEKGREGPIKVSVWPLFFAIGMVCSKFMEKPATSNGYSL